MSGLGLEEPHSERESKFLAKEVRIETSVS